MPRWNIPEAYARFKLPDRDQETIKKQSIQSLHISRRIEQDKLESIQNGTYYQRDSFIVGERFTAHNPTKTYGRGSTVTIYWIDCADCYHKLYLIDTELETRGIDTSK